MCGIEQPLNAHANGVNGDSPGCNLGFPRPYRARRNGADGGIVDSLRRCYADVPCAPLGRGWFWGRGPRVSPRAITVGPFGATRRNAAEAITVGPFGAARRNAAEGDSPRCNLGYRSSIIPLALKGPHNAALQFAESSKREISTFQHSHCILHSSAGEMSYGG
jgi:hypothetical protein